MRETVARPMPWPSTVSPTRLNNEKTSTRRFSGIPMPLSRTEMRQPSGTCREESCTRAGRSGCENFTALVSRFCSTEYMSSGLARTTGSGVQLDHGPLGLEQGRGVEQQLPGHGVEVDVDGCDRRADDTEVHVLVQHPRHPVGGAGGPVEQGVDRAARVVAELLLEHLHARDDRGERHLHVVAELGRQLRDHRRGGLADLGDRMARGRLARSSRSSISWVTLSAIVSSERCWSGVSPRTSGSITHRRPTISPVGA